MSEFSRRLEEYIRLSGYTIYSFARYAGIDRTSLNKITMDRRMPTLDYVKKICGYLKVSDEKKNELIYLYKQEKFGADTVKAWKSIKDFFEEFYYSPVDTDNIRQEDTYITHIPAKIFMEPTTITDSREILIDIILEEINNEKNPEIYMDISWASSSILQFICQRSLWTNLKAHVFMNINQADVRGGAWHNFECLKQVLRSIFYMKEHLDARYVYVNDSSDRDKYQPFDHYIITHGRVILFTDDDWRIKIISDKDIANAFFLRQSERSAMFRTIAPEEENQKKFEDRLDTMGRLYMGRSIGAIQCSNNNKEMIFFVRQDDGTVSYMITDTPEIYREFDDFFEEAGIDTNLYYGETAQKEIKKMPHIMAHI